MTLRKRHDVLGNGTTIKHVSRRLQPGRAALRSGRVLRLQEECEGPGQVGIAPHLAHVWQAPLGHVELR